MRKLDAASWVFIALVGSMTVAMICLTVGIITLRRTGNADLNRDGRVDVQDLSIMSDQWTDR